MKVIGPLRRRHPRCATVLEGNLAHERRIGKVRIRGRVPAAVHHVCEAVQGGVGQRNGVRAVAAA